jgi:hypothetical protein
MMLRDHPLMTRQSGFCTWPPLWTTTHHNKTDKPTGEVGILQQVLRNELIGYRIFLFIDYQGRRYMGSMVFDDERFCAEIYNILIDRIGYSIKQIGDLNLSFTL